MKAYFHQNYGPGKNLALEEINKPVPKAGEVLIKIKASSINPLDWRVMMANPGFIRLYKGLFKPKRSILGADIAGIVEDLGPEVEGLSAGDRVVVDASQGGFAEYVCAPVSLTTKIPENIGFEEAAALPVAGFTALQGLRDHGLIKSGERVLINGASGGVGTYAVQLAKYYGATVDAVCSGKNIDLVKNLGASTVYDYTKDDYTKQNTQYDIIYDAVGNRSVKENVSCLKEGGRFIVAGFSKVGNLLSIALSGKRILKSTGKTVKSFTAQSNKEDLNTLLHILSEGSIKSVIENTYTFDQIPEALDQGTTKRTKGKLVVTY